MKTVSRFPFSSHNGLKPHNYDARVTINLDIAWLRLIQLLLMPPLPPPGRIAAAAGVGCLKLGPAKNFLRIFHGLDCEEIRITLNWASLLRIEQKTSLCCAIVCDIAHILLFKGDLASNKQDQGGRLYQDSKRSNPYPYLIEFIRSVFYIGTIILKADERSKNQEGGCK